LLYIPFIGFVRFFQHPISITIKSYNFRVFFVSPILLIVFQNAFSPDSQVAWGLIKIKEDLPAGETYDEWYPLTGRQGVDKEGMINVIMSITVSL
jgi:hypothetical protein